MKRRRNVCVCVGGGKWHRRWKVNWIVPPEADKLLSFDCCWPSEMAVNSCLILPPQLPFFFLLSFFFLSPPLFLSFPFPLRSPSISAVHACLSLHVLRGMRLGGGGRGGDRGLARDNNTLHLGIDADKFKYARKHTEVRAHTTHIWPTCAFAAFPGMVYWHECVCVWAREQRGHHLDEEKRAVCVHAWMWGSFVHLSVCVWECEWVCVGPLAAVLPIWAKWLANTDLFVSVCFLLNCFPLSLLSAPHTLLHSSQPWRLSKRLTKLSYYSKGNLPSSTVIS